MITEADVLITAALAERPARQPNLVAENQALYTLAPQLMDEPQSRLKTLVRLAKDLCAADTTGISLLETLPDGTSVFRWVAIAGALEFLEQGTAPGDFSPCNTTISCGQAQLYAYPERYFTYLCYPQFPLVEVLLLPICVNQEQLGTIWLISHNQQRQFDREDQRLMTSLAGFTAVALQSMHLRQMAAAGLRREEEIQSGYQRAETSLRQSEEFNRQILSSTDECIKVLTFSGQILYMNPRGQELIGLQDLTSLLNSSWLEFWQGVDRQAALQAIDTAKAGGVGSFQGYCPTLAGEPKWWDVKLTAMRGMEGQGERLLCISRDITEQKQVETALRQSEERYRYLAESIPQLVWTASSDGMLLDVNQRWSDFTGLTLAQAAIAGWEAVVHPDDIFQLSHQWTVAQQKSTRYQAEGRMRRADGVYRWHLHQAVPITNEQGQVINWVGTATDIEERKQLEQQRDDILQQEQAARKEAEAANRIKDEFLAVLSHELRSPLNPILGWSKLLQGGKLGAEKTVQALATIERNAKLQAQLIDDLLDISRILQGKLTLNNFPVHLSFVISAAIDTVRLAIDAKAIQLQLAIDPAVGQVLGDAARLQQVVWNLLSNAAKFTPAKGRIALKLTQVGNEAQIQVTDNGKGIQPEFLPYVFEHFRQEDGATTRKFGGLGLGLAIVRQIVEMHGGTVRAESPGESRGATFTVKLPLANMAPTPALTMPSSLPSISLEGCRVLVVDDEADMRELAKFTLNQSGAEVSTAASAAEALKLLDQLIPDILISDIGIPEIDGYMLMRQVRERDASKGGQVPAIALTAYAGEIDQQQALAAGFQQHLSKPIEPQELVRAIANLLNQSHPEEFKSSPC